VCLSTCVPEHLNMSECVCLLMCGEAGRTEAEACGGWAEELLS
jgi:hypothetical protein